MNFFWLTIGILCVWRITHLFQAEDGPWQLIVRIRAALGNSFAGNLMDCFYCLSLWVAVPFAWLLAPDWKNGLLLWPALSAGAIVLERLTSRKLEAQYEAQHETQVEAQYIEDESEEPIDFKNDVKKEQSDVVLR